MTELCRNVNRYASYKNSVDEDQFRFNTSSVGATPFPYTETVSSSGVVKGELTLKKEGVVTL